MLKILLLGKNGQLGWECRRSLACLGEVVALDYPEIDFSAPETLPALIQAHGPQVVINAAAYTAVDKAENEQKLCQAINGIAPGVLAEAARKAGAALVHISTDYVFDGDKNGMYVETDVPHPLNVYGLTKLEGERAVEQAGDAWVTLRPSWVYSQRRDSFVSKVLEWASRQPVLKIVDDQIGEPTWARMLAEAISLMIARGGTDPVAYLQERRGIYHLAGWGSTTRCEWAQAILANYAHPEKLQAHEVIPCKTDEFPTPAVRPLRVEMDCSLFQRTFDLQLPPWDESLRLMMSA